MRTERILICEQDADFARELKRRVFKQGFLVLYAFSRAEPLATLPDPEYFRYIFLDAATAKGAFPADQQPRETSRTQVVVMDWEESEQARALLARFPVSLFVKKPHVLDVVPELLEPSHG